MPNRPITILGINPDHTLILDYHRRVARPGDTVTWMIGHDSGVAEITAIRPKDGYPNVFNPSPGPVAHSSHWRGTVDRHINHDVDEHYCISYRTTAGASFDVDPIISVRPVAAYFRIMRIVTVLASLLCVSLLFRGRKKHRK